MGDNNQIFLTIGTHMNQPSTKQLYVKGIWPFKKITIWPKEAQNFALRKINPKNLADF